MFETIVRAESQHFSFMLDFDPATMRDGYRSITLEDEDPGNFQIFLKWATQRPSNFKIHDLNNHDFTRIAVRLYAMGRRFEAANFTKDILDRLQHLVQKKGVSVLKVAKLDLARVKELDLEHTPIFDYLWNLDPGSDRTVRKLIAAGERSK